MPWPFNLGAARPVPAETASGAPPVKALAALHKATALLRSMSGLLKGTSLSLPGWGDFSPSSGQECLETEDETGDAFQSIETAEHNSDVLMDMQWLRQAGKNLDLNDDLELPISECGVLPSSELFSTTAQNTAHRPHRPGMAQPIAVPGNPFDAGSAVWDKIPVDPCEIPTSQFGAQVREKLKAPGRQSGQVPDGSPAESLLPSLKDAAESLGYCATPDLVLFNGGRVSLALQSDWLKLAVYLPDTEDTAAEADKVMSILRSNYAYVLICSEDACLTGHLRTYLGKIAADQLPWLRFGNVDKTLAMLQILTRAYQEPEVFTASTGKRFLIKYSPLHRTYPQLAQALKQSAKTFIREDEYDG